MDFIPDQDIIANVSLDCETQSEKDLKKQGAYTYAEGDEFDVQMITFKRWGKKGLIQYDLTKEELPEEVVKGILLNPRVRKWSHNAWFERLVLGKKYNNGVPLPVEQWRCSMVQGAQAGYPLSLDASSKATGCGVEKMKSGKDGITLFSTPIKRQTKKTAGRRWNKPEHLPEKWENYLKYNRHDVRTEYANLEITRQHGISEFEWKLWQLDQKINERGVKIDKKFVRNALAIHAEYAARIKAEGEEISGLKNMNSPKALREWVLDQGEYLHDLKKASVAELLADLKSGNVSRVLEIRQELAKTSIKKYVAMLNVMSKDGRLHGLTQFYGAGRTGRWAGRLVQLQNLPQNKFKYDPKNNIDDLKLARSMVRRGYGRRLKRKFGNVPDTLSQLIRTALIPEKGHEFLVADFSAIEARVIAWLFEEDWRQEVFGTHGMIYEASASQMFKVTIDSIRKKVNGEWVEGPNYSMRAKGKIAELALGYGGALNAMINMGGAKMGLEEDEMIEIVRAWRKANQKIVKGWYALDDQVKYVIKNPKRGVVSFRGIKIFMRGKDLKIKLPSGRELSYIGAHLKQKVDQKSKKPMFDRWGNPMMEICYYGLNDKNKWAVLRTYGGKLTENIVQAIARDCLAVAMMRLDYKGYQIVFHVHDEVVCEMPIGQCDIKRMERIMSKPMKWAPDLLLAADGFKTLFYKK